MVEIIRIIMISNKRVKWQAIVGGVRCMMGSSINNKDSSRFSKVAEPKSDNPQFEDFRRRPQNPSKSPIENKLSQM